MVKNQEYKHSFQFHVLSIYFLGHWDDSEMEKSPGFRATTWVLVLALELNGHVLGKGVTSLNLSVLVSMIDKTLMVVLSVNWLVNMKIA